MGVVDAVADKPLQTTRTGAHKPNAPWRVRMVMLPPNLRDPESLSASRPGFATGGPDRRGGFPYPETLVATDQFGGQLDGRRPLTVRRS